MTSVPLRKCVPVLAAIFVTLAATPAWCQYDEQPAGAAKQGGYVGLSFLPDFTFDGLTFDGETAYREVDGDELMFLPRVDTQRMFRGILGYRARRAALEVSYERTKHVGSFLGEFPLDATFQAINVDARLFFATGSRVQPHLLFGGVYPMLNIEEGSFLHDTFADARFKGYGVNTEAGVTVYAMPQLGIGVGYAYRSIWFDRARGVSDKLFSLKPKFRETSGSLVITAHFVL